MRKIRIDFAAPGLRTLLHRVPLRAWALVPIVLALGLSLASGAMRYRDELAAIARLQAQARLRAGAADVARVAALPVVKSVPDAEAAAVNAAVMQLNLPWRGLHDAVQAATPANVALLALEPDAKKSSVRITAEAKSSDAMLAYVGELKNVEWFGAVALVRHEINEQDPNRPIRFQIDAQWQAVP